MDDIYIYLVPLPHRIHEAVLPCADGYTIYIADWLDTVHRERAYRHALTHIKNKDWYKGNVNEIEDIAHKERRNA